MKTEQQIQDSIGWVFEHEDEVDPHVCYRCMEHIDNCECENNDGWVHISELEQYVNDPDYNQGPC
jgi:hypothetical protein